MVLNSLAHNVKTRKSILKVDNYKEREKILLIHRVYDYSTESFKTALGVLVLFVCLKGGFSFSLPFW